MCRHLVRGHAISVFNHCLEWYKFVDTHLGLYHSSPDSGLTYTQPLDYRDTAPTNKGGAVQGCRGCGDSHGDSHGYGCGMGMRTVMNLHRRVGILWGFLNGCDIKRKRVKHAINIAVDVCISPNAVQFLACFAGIFFFIVVVECR